MKQWQGLPFSICSCQSLGLWAPHTVSGPLTLPSSHCVLPRLEMRGSTSTQLSLDLNFSDISTHLAQLLPEGFPGKGQQLLGPMESCEGMGIRCLLAVTAGAQEPRGPHPSGGDKRYRQKGRGALALQCNLHKGALWPPLTPRCCKTVERSGCMLTAPPQHWGRIPYSGHTLPKARDPMDKCLFRKFIGSS